MHICTCVESCIYGCMNIHMLIHIHICLYIYACKRICLCIYIYVHISIRIWIDPKIHLYVYSHIYICMYMGTYVNAPIFTAYHKSINTLLLRCYHSFYSAPVIKTEYLHHIFCTYTTFDITFIMIISQCFFISHHLLEKWSMYIIYFAVLQVRNF
jgi:hypothetical protein